MTENVLELIDVKKSYGDNKILTDLSLKITRGEVVCLAGPSGCGKTTIFRLVAGLTKVNGGKVKFVGGMRLGYVFQEPRLLPWKTIEENLAFVQRNYLTGEEAAILRNRLLLKIGLKNFTNSYPEQLSGGMKQRLEIARALSIKPDFLLLDEPFKSIDTAMKLKVKDLFIDYLAENENSIFMITHDPVETVLLADRIYLLSSRPATIFDEIKINRKRQERSLKDKEVYEALDRIFNFYTGRI